MKILIKKGYSLAELLIAIAIFSFVMLGIVAIMGSTSNSYRRTMFEAKTQEDAQIVLNQIEDLLCDAEAAAGWSDSNKAFTFDGVEHGTVALQFDSDNNELLYCIGGVGAEDSNKKVLCENVSAFSVDAGDPLDNCATVYLTINNDNHKYSGVREVFYRNKIEDPNMGDTLVPSSATPSTDPSSYTYTIVVNRYGCLNLSALTKGSTTWNDGNEEAQKWYTVSYENKDNKGFYQYIYPKDGLNTSFLQVNDESNPCVFTNDDGETCLVTTEKVEIGKKTNGFDGSFSYHANNSVNGEGYMSYIATKGIDMYGAIDNGVSVTYKMKLTVGTETKTDGITSHTMQKYEIAKKADDNNGFKVGSQIMPLEFEAVKGVDGIAIVTANSTVNSKSSEEPFKYILGSDNRVLYLDIDIGGNSYPLKLGMGINYKDFGFQ